MTKQYFVSICGGIPMIYPRTPRCPQDRWRLKQQLKRIEVRLEASRGEVMNMGWMGWMEQCMAVQDALEGKNQ